MVPHPRRPAPPTWATAATPLPSGPHRLIAYHVLGELAAYPPRLLVRGDDGHTYVFDLASGAIVPCADEVGWTGTGPLDPAVN